MNQISIKMNKMINDLYSMNSYEIFDEYHEYFEKNKDSISTRYIKKKREFYRARQGRFEVGGSIDDCDIDVRIAYFDKELVSPPPKFASGGRFNRENFSFLYLATDVKTCISEIRLEVNQECSIGKFYCNTGGTYVDLTKLNNIFIQEVSKILLKPVNSENRYDYLISQFISDIFRNMGYKGIIYPSTQGKGINLVSFYPNEYTFIPYSEKMYKATKITYSYKEISDSYKDYYDYEKLLDSYNERENESKEKLFDYINKKIEFELESEIKKKLNDIDKYSDFTDKVDGYNELVSKYSSKNIVIKFYRGDFYVKNKLYSLAIKDYLSTRFITSKGIDFKNRICMLIEAIKEEKDFEAMKLINEQISNFINHNHLNGIDIIIDIQNMIKKYIVI